MTVYDRSVEVRMTVECACEGCKAQAICGDGEDNERVVIVWTEHASLFKPGEKVVVGVTQVMGIKAVMWTYVVPVLMMLAILTGGKSSGLDGAVTGGATLGAAAAYYFVLWLLRHRIEKVTMLKIRKM